MGGRAAESLGLDVAPVTVEETVRGITKQVCANIDHYCCCSIVNILAD